MVLADLRDHGPLNDPEGRATARLMQRMEYRGSHTGFNAILQALEDAGLVVRDVHGRRTTRIALSPTALADPRLGPPAGTPSESGTGDVPPATVRTLPPAAPAAPAAPVPAGVVPAPVPAGLTSGGTFDVSALAQALLERVIDLAGVPQRDSRKMAEMLDRLGTLAVENERLRRENAALVAEVAGLRVPGRSGPGVHLDGGRVEALTALADDLVDDGDLVEGEDLEWDSDWDDDVPGDGPSPGEGSSV